MVSPLPVVVAVWSMSGPSTMPLCQAASSCMSSIGLLLAGMRSAVSGTDQMMVLIGGFR